MSSKLDFRGVDKAFGQERVRYWGILQRKSGLVNVLSWGSWIFRVLERAWATELQLSTYAAMGVGRGWNDCG